ncbi:hypothetical protein [Clostridium sp.]|uniref:hypothetical protein n=1 Tax=Clostridium sp. TaxID=1506 RepID=UPI003216D740
MKISKREKILLVVLALVIVSTGYYKLVYENQHAKLQGLRLEAETLNTEYENMQVNINTLLKNKEDIKILNSNISSKSMLLYPKLSQEKIIIEINELLNKAGIKGNLSFSEITVAPIEAYFSGEEEGEKVQPSLEQIVEDTDKEPTKEEVKEKLEDAKELGDDQAAEKDAQATASTAGLLVEQMKVSISFTGTYIKSMKFVELVSEYERLIAMPNITLTASGTDEVSGSLDLEFYSVPKVNGEDSEYLKWPTTEKYGKENPFLEGSGALSTSKIEKKDGYGLIMSLKSVNSDLPSITVGKANDTTKETYVYSDENEKIDVEIEVSEDNGKCYFKYKTPKSSYPSDYTKTGTEIKDEEGNIEIGIYSSSRIDINDKVAANVKIINKTNKKVAVTILDDDKSNPRVKVITEGKVDYVNK